MAKMLGVWINVNNPDRSPSEDVNLQVGGTIVLTKGEVAKLVKGELFNVGIIVMDWDHYTPDDFVYRDNTFSVGVYDTTPRSFTTGVIVPHDKVKNSEPSWENWAEIYCRVAASQGPIKTPWRNSQNEDVRID